LAIPRIPAHLRVVSAILSHAIRHILQSRPHLIQLETEGRALCHAIRMELMVFHVDLVIRNEVRLSLPSHLEKSLVDLIRLFHVVAGLLSRKGGVLEARERRALAVHEHFLAVLVILVLQIGLRADASQRGVRVVHAAVETVGVLMAAHEVVLHALRARVLVAEGAFHFLAEHGGVVIGADAAVGVLCGCRCR